MERYRVRASYNNAAHHISLPPKLASPHPEPASFGRRIEDNDTEISIFDAERYFNGGGGSADDGTPKTINKTAILNGSGTGTTATGSFVDVISSTNPRDSSASSVASSADGGYGRTGFFRSRSFRASAATPTASSEASWNSQTGLLAYAPGSVAVSVRAYPLDESRRKESDSASSFRGGRRRRFFGMRCPCYGKKSVEVEDKFSETRSSIRSSRHGSAAGGLGFPKPDVDDVLSDSSARVPNKEAMELMAKFKIRATEPPGLFSFPVPPPRKELELEPARESLEVFRPSEELARTPRKSSQLQHLRMAPVRDDDMASDTSSDLFELESFSGRVRRRDSLDDLPKVASTASTAGLQLRRSSEDSVAPSECYAPSEASVEWSVTTAEWGLDRASVANFSTAASDCGMGRFDSEAAVAAAAGKEGGGVKKRGGGGGGGLLNCRSEKAVSVGPKPVRVGPD
ncbi:protein PHYTOCHROME KINASE SUBSTRATE 4 [Iris pallida]|uniref:Protein PHYTOCHROME KINASE SUBSTRATE 4 n=1 Tax=Iris pallida TaxID=29817 RepID=A0AAX6F2U9_IRIPA|nr:protein PHYTOCHROME KINASE SUBSTRATE 4 [Iris pallida]